MLKNSLGYFILLIFIVLALENKQLMEIYIGIVLNTNLVVLFATLIAGLFGFVIAVIPFAIQLFNQDKKSSEFHTEMLTKEKFNTFVVPLFKRFSKILKIMLSFFIFISILHVIQTIDVKSLSFLEQKYGDIMMKEYLFLVVFYCYIIFIWHFFRMLQNIVRDLETMIFTFIKQKRKGLDK